MAEFQIFGVAASDDQVANLFRAGGSIGLGGGGKAKILFFFWGGEGVKAEKDWGGGGLDWGGGDLGGGG